MSHPSSLPVAPGVGWGHIAVGQACIIDFPKHGLRFYSLQYSPPQKRPRKFHHHLVKLRVGVSEFYRFIPFPKTVVAKWRNPYRTVRYGGCFAKPSQTRGLGVAGKSTGKDRGSISTPAPSPFVHAQQARMPVLWRDGKWSKCVLVCISVCPRSMFDAVIVTWCRLFGNCVSVTGVTGQFH